MAKINDDTSGLVSIGQLARDSGVTSRTIRYYEELGILPAPGRSAGGTRKYPREYGGYLSAALALKDLGFRLDEIKALTRLAAGRQVSAGQRDSAARLVRDRIEVLSRQVVVLRRLHDSVSRPGRAAPVSAVLGTADIGLLGGELPENSRYAGNEVLDLEHHGEAGMTNGLILLGFIAILIAVVVARVRRRIGVPVRTGFYGVAVAGIAIFVLILWATQNH